MIILASFLVLIIGLLLYGFATNPKLEEIGRLMFMMGLLALLLRMGGDTLAVLR